MPNARICPVADADLYQAVGKLEGRLEQYTKSSWSRLEDLDEEGRTTHMRVDRLSTEVAAIPKKLNGSQKKMFARDAGMGSVGGALIMVIMKLLETV